MNTVGAQPKPIPALPTFDFAAFFDAVDQARKNESLSWFDLADEAWDQSAQLNAERNDHALCGGAISRLGGRGESSCQYALYLLRWLRRAPEEFLNGPTRHRGEVRLPEPGVGRRLRWDLRQLHTAINDQRQEHGLTWTALAIEIGCTPARLTNLRTARMADMTLVMRLTQWLGETAATFIQPAGLGHRSDLL